MIRRWKHAKITIFAFSHSQIEYRRVGRAGSIFRKRRSLISVNWRWSSRRSRWAGSSTRVVAVGTVFCKWDGVFKSPCGLKKKYCKYTNLHSYRSYVEKYQNSSRRHWKSQKLMENRENPKRIDAKRAERIRRQRTAVEISQTARTSKISTQLYGFGHLILTLHQLPSFPIRISIFSGISVPFPYYFRKFNIWILLNFSWIFLDFLYNFGRLFVRNHLVSCLLTARFYTKTAVPGVSSICWEREVVDSFVIIFGNKTFALKAPEFIRISESEW